MKKIIMFISFIVLFTMPLFAKAETKYGYCNVTGSSFAVRSSAARLNNNTIGVLYGGVNVEIVDTTSGNGCSSWYKIKYNNGYGWVCGISSNGDHNIELYSTQTLRTNNREPSNDYERQLKNAGFPSSYWDKLSALHSKHSNWNFIANNTGRDWSYATWAETGAVADGDDDKSLIQAPGGDTDLIAGYLKTDNYNYKTNKFNLKDSGYFYAARQEMVAYYMDPRNFLNENFIFQFELLSYNSSYHTTSVVEGIFGNGYLRKYASNYVSAGKSKGVSPVHMATRSVQEGRNVEDFLTTGASFNYAGKKYSSFKIVGDDKTYSITNKKFEKCYNFFNIGAYSDEWNAKHNAGVYACGGPFTNETSYGRPWNTVDKGIVGGAQYIGGDYVAVGQDTLYFQKYNTASYTKTDVYGHQYMSNISAVAYEGSDTYDGYNAKGLINSVPFTFVIPVYNNMPEKTVLPSSLSPNNYLSSLKVDGESVSGFDGAKTEGYSLTVPNMTSSVKITANAVVSGTSIDLNNKSVDLNVGSNTISVVVTALNGEKRTYKINVVRENKIDVVTNTVAEVIKNTDLQTNDSYIGNITVKTSVSSISSKIKNINNNVNVNIKDKNNKDKGTSSVLATGDKIILKLNSEEKTYTVYVYGDVNGDGEIKANDYLMIKDKIMGKYNLSGVYAKASDVNKDGKPGANDYLMIKDYIMGKLKSL